MHFEVVVPGELLVAEAALRHGPVGVVRELVPTQHLLQAEGQVTHLEDSTGDSHWGHLLMGTGTHASYSLAIHTVYFRAIPTILSLL